MRDRRKASCHCRHIELDGGEAFVHDCRHGFVPIPDGDVEAFGREFITGALSSEPVGELARDETYMEEMGRVAFDPDEEDDMDFV